jgi:phosphotransferase system HPr-like phosphotransfer protein
MIKTMDILLPSVDAVKSFVNVVGNMPGDVTIVSGRYVIDAKSIMGIFSLDLSKPMKLEIEEWKDEYMDKLNSFLDVSV